MSQRNLWLSFALLTAAAVGWLGWHTQLQPGGTHAVHQTPGLTAAEAGKRLAQLPLRFEANQGQADGQVRFVAHGLRQQFWLTDEEAVLALPAAQPLANPDKPPAIVRIKPLKANPQVRLQGQARLPSQSHFLLGNEPRRWRTHVTNYARVKYEAVYPGVDLIWYGNEQRLEYDFIVAPGADPRQIKLQITGAERLELDASGDLLLHTAAGLVRQHKPLIYQERQGMRQVVAGGYQLEEAGQVSFQIGAYDAAQPLVIDPVLSYSTYLGGTRDVRFFGLNIGDFPADIAVDAAGNAYVAGYSVGTDFPTEKPLQAALKAAPDAIIFKLNPAGNALVYATYLGGNSFDSAGGIAVDGAGNAYLTGATESTDFPIVRPLQGTIRKGAGFGDAFIAKLSPDGSALVYSTFFGGSGAEVGSGIAVDANGNAYVTGTTFGSPDLPLEKPLQAAYGGGTCVFDGDPIPCPDAFVTKLNAAGDALLYSTYLGGNQFEGSTGIALDGQGQATIAGATSSANFPTRNAVKASYAGGSCPDFPCTDAFVSKLTADGSALVFSTYLGGAQPATGSESTGAFDLATGVAADSAGNSYLTGYTNTRDFPLLNALRSTNSSGEAFVTKLDPAGALVYSTFLGGSNVENAYHVIVSFYAIIGDTFNHCIAVDAAGNAYVTGYSSSDDFPLREPIQDKQRGLADIFVSKLDAAGTLVWSTLLGGTQPDDAFAIAVDPAGNAYVAGVTNSADFPTVNARQTSLRGSGDIFVAKLGASTVAPTTVACVSAASFSGTAFAPEAIVAAFGVNLANSTQMALTIPLPTTLAGTTVTVRDSTGTTRAAPLFFVAPGQINFLVPTGTATGSATLTVTNGGLTVGTGALPIAPVAPGLFAANSNGQGVPAGRLLRVNANGAQSFEPILQFDAAQNRYLAVPIDFGAATDQVFLILYGTGVRGRSALAATSIVLGGTDAAVVFAGAQGDLIGLDQLNVRLPRSLAGRGEAILQLTVDGLAANPLRVSFQ